MFTDALAVTSVEFISPALVWPDEIYQVTFGMTVRNTGSTDMMFAPDSKVFVLSASLSETGEYDTGTSIPLNVTLNYQGQSSIRIKVSHPSSFIPLNDKSGDKMMSSFNLIHLLFMLFLCRPVARGSYGDTYGWRGHLERSRGRPDD